MTRAPSTNHRRYIDREHVMRVYKGHDPTLGEDGTDVLLTVHDDGAMEVALRPGLNQTHLTWGPPTEPVEVAS